jgi:hypothetical protein
MPPRQQRHDRACPHSSDTIEYTFEDVNQPGWRLVGGFGGLPSGRFELTIGEPEQWVPGHRDHDAIRARARHILPSWRDQQHQ